MEGPETLAYPDDVDWRTLMGAVPDAVIVSDASGKIIYVNPAVEQYFGYKPAQLFGQAVEILVPKAVHARHIEHRASYHREPRQRMMGFGQDLSAVRADGSEFPVSIGLGFTSSANGNLVIAVVQDLTALRERDRSIETLSERMARAAELREINKELETFSYSVSHDLRSPLRVVDGFSQVLEEDYATQLDEYGRSCVGRIRNAAQRMGQLIDDLLNLSRISRSELVIGDVDLTALTHSIVAVLREANPDRDIEVTVANGLKASGDPGLLRIALENLIGNAFKFSAGHAAARIEVGRMVNGHGDEFYVRDNGAGFDMNYADKLFGAFQRMHNARDFPGTGIGLATVQRVVNRHGGHIRAEAEIGNGATFYFTFSDGGEHAKGNYSAG